MKKDEEINYDVYIDIDFAKRFLYKHNIEQYGIIDNLIEVKVHRNNVHVKYKIQKVTREYIFEGNGFELLKEYRLSK